VLPAGAKRGGVTELQAAGVNLDGVDRVVLEGVEAKVVSATSNLVTFRLNIPSSVSPGRYWLHAFAGKTESPLLIPLIISDLEEQLSAPARKRAEPQPVKAPVALSGSLDRKRDAHFFALDAKEGDRIVFDVDAMKLGYLVDPILAVYAPDGQLIASDDDRLQQNGKQVPNLDPYLVYAFEKAGRYTIMIRDLAERGDANYAYRLAIYPAQPDFDLKIMAPTVTLYRGQTVTLPARVRRHGGWDTPIDVFADNLPAGVTNERQTADQKPTIVTDDCSLERRLDGTDVHVPFTVAANAALGSYTFPLRARSGTVEHVGEVQYKWESVGKVSGPIEDQQLTVTVADLPTVLLDAPDTLTVPVGKPARFRVLVTRFDGGKTPLTIESDTPLEGVKFENNVIAPGASQIELRISASGKIKPVNFRLKAGPGLSQRIALRGGQGEDDDQ